jgi:hypothetical protein
MRISLKKVNPNEYEEIHAIGHIEYAKKLKLTGAAAPVRN